MFRPKFVISQPILSNIAKAEAAKAIIENAPLVPAWEAQFRKEALIRTVHHGTHIEGNKLNFSEAQQVLDGRQIEARERDIQEVINYRNVVKHIDGLKARNSKKITLAEALHLHRLIVEKIFPAEQAGNFRKTQVLVKNSRTGEVSFIPPKANFVPSLVADFLTWLNLPQPVHPIIKAGITHYELARIHPFIDGNGRWARAMATLVLFLDGYDIKRFFSLEEYYDRNAARYYQTLQKVSNQKIARDEDRNLTPWLEYFTEGLAIELLRVKEKVVKLSADAKLKAKVGQLALSERQAKLMEYLQSYGRVSNREWRSLLPDISDDTILRDLKYLLDKKLIRKKGKTKAAVYIMR